MQETSRESAHLTFNKLLLLLVWSQLASDFEYDGTVVAVFCVLSLQIARGRID